MWYCVRPKRNRKVALRKDIIARNEMPNLIRLVFLRKHDFLHSLIHVAHTYMISERIVELKPATDAMRLPARYAATGQRRTRH
jgi:hypothetical protein